MKTEIERARLYKEAYRLIARANKLLQDIYEDCLEKTSKKAA